MHHWVMKWNLLSMGLSGCCFSQRSIFRSLMSTPFLLMRDSFRFLSRRHLRFRAIFLISPFLALFSNPHSLILVLSCFALNFWKKALAFAVFLENYGRIQNLVSTYVVQNPLLANSALIFSRVILG